MVYNKCIIGDLSVFVYVCNRYGAQFEMKRQFCTDLDKVTNHWSVLEHLLEKINFWVQLCIFATHIPEISECLGNFEHVLPTLAFISFN